MLVYVGILFAVETLWGSRAVITKVRSSSRNAVSPWMTVNRNMSAHYQPTTATVNTTAITNARVVRSSSYAAMAAPPMREPIAFHPSANAFMPASNASWSRSLPMVRSKWIGVSSSYAHFTPRICSA